LPTVCIENSLASSDAVLEASDQCRFDCIALIGICERNSVALSRKLTSSEVKRFLAFPSVLRPQVTENSSV